MVVLANGTILHNSGRRTVRLKSKSDDGMNPWIQPRSSNGASFASRNTSLAGVGVFSFFWAHDAILVDTAASDVKLRLGKTKRKHHDSAWRRSDTYSEEMGQSDLSRRIAHGDPGYPVLTILNPFFVASPAASTKADIGPPAVISSVGSPRRPGRGRTGSVSWGRSGEGPARRRWRHIARNALSAVGCPTFESVGS